MSTAPTYGSLFSGIGGFDLALDRAGFDCQYQVEIDRTCVSVLSRHWPNVARHGDIAQVKTESLPAVDLIVGGFPCQDLSVAGRRAGLGGERSGLFFEFMRISDAFPAAWVLIENVPGLLSSQRGRDFAVLLGRVTGFEPGVPKGGWKNSGVCIGPDRTAAWRVLDAQNFGVAQRRRRVFVVAGPGAGTGAVQILFERQGGYRDPAEGGKAGEVASAIPAGGAGTGGTDAPPSAVDVRNMKMRIGLSGTLQAKETGSYSLNYQNPVMVARPLKGGGNDRHDESHETYIVGPGGKDLSHAVTHAKSGMRFDPTEETFVIQDVRGGTRDKTDQGQGIGITEGGSVYTLGAVERHAVATPEAYGIRDGEEGSNGVGIQEERSHTLRDGTPHMQRVGDQEREDLAHAVRSNPSKADKPDSTTYVVAFAENQRAEVREMEIMPSIGGGGGKPGKGYPAIHTSEPTAMRESGNDRAIGEGISPSVDASSDKRGPAPTVAQGMVVRRLTPTECERLQAFPDGWTAFAADGKPIADSPRYRMLGNGVCSSVAWWIGMRIRAVIEGRDPDLESVDIAGYISSLNSPNLVGVAL